MARTTWLEQWRKLEKDLKKVSIDPLSGSESFVCRDMLSDDAPLVAFLRNTAAGVVAVVQDGE